MITYAAIAIAAHFRRAGDKAAADSFFPARARVARALLQFAQYFGDFHRSAPSIDHQAKISKERRGGPCPCCARERQSYSGLLDTDECIFRPIADGLGNAQRYHRARGADYTLRIVRICAIVVPKLSRLY